MSKDLRIIQMTVALDSVGKHLIFAVCNDGSLWRMDKGIYEREVEWEEVPGPTRKSNPVDKAIRKGVLVTSKKK